MRILAILMLLSVLPSQAAAEGDRGPVEYPMTYYVTAVAVRDSLPEILVMNKALIDYEHRWAYPWVLQIVFPFTETADRGMPTPKERDVVGRLNADLEEIVLRDFNAVWVARSTWRGSMESMYHVGDPEEMDRVLRPLLDMDREGHYWEYVMSPDEDWEIADGYLGLIDGAAPVSEGMLPTTEEMEKAFAEVDRRLGSKK